MTTAKVLGKFYSRYNGESRQTEKLRLIWLANLTNHERKEWQGEQKRNCRPRKVSAPRGQERNLAKMATLYRDQIRERKMGDLPLGGRDSWVQGEK